MVVLMRGGFTKVEETLLQDGRSESVLQQRRDLQAAMRPRFKEVIEEELGRMVAGFMGGSHQHPDLLGRIHPRTGKRRVPRERPGRRRAYRRLGAKRATAP